jgi:predicted TIM-barrel fold metal-dependent hydrolase
VDHTAPNVAIPAGACDCHVHVFDPRFPYASSRTFTPGVALRADLERHLDALGIDRVVIVQPSTYGTDNGCTLEAADQLGNRARVVAVLPHEVPAKELEDLHRRGVRGVRINLETAGIHDPALARDRVTKEAARAAALGWHVQVFTNLAVIAELRDTIEALPVPVVFDHFGRAQAAHGTKQPGFESLLGLLRSGNAYVKLSAPYLISSQADYADVADIAQALIEANEERVVWASNWPHPGGQPGARKLDVIENFRREDDGLALHRMRRWVRDPQRWQKLLVDNPGRLYGF